MDCTLKKSIKKVANDLIIIISLTSFIFVGAALIRVTTPIHAKKSNCAFLAELFIPDNAGSMEKNEKPAQQKTMYFSVPAVIGGQNLDNAKPTLKVVEYKTLQNADFSRFDRLTTTASISSRKALEFTLVGAKPSGTS